MSAGRTFPGPLSVAVLVLATMAAGACSAPAAEMIGHDPAAPSTLLIEPGPPPATRAMVATAIGTEVVAYREPLLSSARQGRFANPIESGSPLVFQVINRREGWLQVLLPVRPNGSTGWIEAEQVTLTQTPYRIEVDVSDHRLRVLDDGRAIVDTAIGIGTGDNPTPIGSFYLTELVASSDPTGPYGPFAFGLSGYSETLQAFNGGRGVIGIHGTNDPSSLGRNASLGCIRVANDVIEDMVAYLPLGTPVTVTR
jgi:lipoprotein-anchoring transpeptidase ErfK/SrfK